jgi:hypothetical protein
MRLPLATKSAPSRSRALSAERVINMVSEVQQEGAKSPVALFSAPGHSSFASVGLGPIRGMHRMDDVLYVVSGAGVYKVATNGAGTLLGSLNTSIGPVYMADNGSQLVITSGTDAYVATSTTLTLIGDVDLPDISTVAYMDGYHIFGRSGTGQFYISAISDATSYDALDFATAEGNPDDLLRVWVDHQQLWLIGSSSMEVWSDTGAALFPFERLPGAVIDRGTAAAASVAKLADTFAWLGDDLIVYRAEGYQPVRISTHPVEQAIAGYSAVSDAIAFSYSMDGHSYYVLTFPTALATWVYDASTGLWHERDSRVSAASIGRWRATCYAKAYGKHLIGDYSTGTVWELSTSVYAEASESLVRTIQCPPLYSEGKRAFMYSLEVDMEVGVGLASGQGSDPMVMLQWSDDGGRTWSAEITAGMGTSIGAIGEYRTRVTFNRLGSFRQRTLRLSVSDPVKCVIYGINAEIVGGTS